MQKLWDEVERLIAENAQHRKGFRLQEVSLDFLFNHAADELQELRDSPTDPVEFVDLLAILIHLAIRQGWTPAMLERIGVEKMQLRFAPVTCLCIHCGKEFIGEQPPTHDFPVPCRSVCPGSKQPALEVYHHRERTGWKSSQRT
jgi:hypothetical protein